MSQTAVPLERRRGLHRRALWSPGRRRPGAERVLDRHLRQARQILAAHPDGDGRALPVLPGPLERLRWFELPPSMPCRPLLYDLARGR